jgi:hypothetical protein
METDHPGDEGSDPRGGAGRSSGNQGPKSGPRNGAGGTQFAGPNLSGSAPEIGAQGSGHKKATFVLSFPQGPVPVTTASSSLLAPEESFAMLPVGAERIWADVGADNGGAALEATGQEASGGNSDVDKDLELPQEVAMSSAELQKALQEIGDEEEVTMKDDGDASGVEQLAAIPEASPDLSSARRSKHRAGEVDEFVGLSAERRKALRNEGMSTGSDPAPFAPDSVVVSNM